MKATTGRPGEKKAAERIITQKDKNEKKKEEES